MVIGATVPGAGEQQGSTVASAVRDQYESYPYPPREPLEEHARLLAPVADSLDFLNHFGFGGRRDFGEPFRVLVAGGGTGDSVVFLAEQLRNDPAEIHYLDISASSMAVAQSRAQERRLENICWQQASLLDLPQLGLGRFNYINCSGVLHHLQDPDAGLAVLTDVLADDGVMTLMVYGQHARTGVYQLQELLRLLESDADTPDARLSRARELLDQLPGSNWFQHGKALFGDYALGDAGLYDLLLHSQDRAYTVPELYEFTRRAGLSINQFVDAHEYEPAGRLDDKLWTPVLAQQSREQRYAIGELLAGTLKTHTVLVSRRPAPLPSIDDMDMVPSLAIASPVEAYAQFHALTRQTQQAGQAIFRHRGASLSFATSAPLAAALKYVDGDRSLDAIYRAAARAGKHRRQALQAALRTFYATLSRRGLMYLRHKGVPRCPTVAELHGRLSKD